MASLMNLASVRRQHLLSEFTGLKQACPEGVFVSLTPGDPTLWSAILFVREGPYADAVLRFQVSFPEAYPRAPPVILLSTDVFHPLTAPLTTYMHTTDIQDNGTVSATDDERLSAGGFSLSHGFPEWFGRKRASAEVRRVSGDRIASPVSDDSSEFMSPDTSHRHPQSGKPPASMYKVLKYLRSTFDTAEVLDSVPLSAAGNPGAWHAWQAYRKKLGALQDQGAAPGNVASSAGSESGAPSPNPTVRRPGEWNWDGVWEDRVKRNIAASLSEPVLYGGAGVADEVIRFLPIEEEDVESVKDNLIRTLDSAT